MILYGIGELFGVEPVFKEQKINQGGTQIPSKFNQFWGLLFWLFGGFPKLKNDTFLGYCITHYILFSYF